MKVANKKCIRRLSLKNMKYTKGRNTVAVLAIALTTILFTAFFTIFMSIIDSIQYSNFRMVGTMSHGEFKRLTYEQYSELKDDPDIKEDGLRRIVGVVSDERFNKTYTEVSYMSKNTAKWSFISMTEGTLPEENTNRVAMDTRVIETLGIEKKIGAEFSLEIDVDGTITTESFTLCGWWDYDPISPASHILLPESKVDEILGKLNTQCYDGVTGRYFLDVMLNNSFNIEEKFNNILSRHGFSNSENSENGIALGINWGYMSEQTSASLDGETIVTIALVLILIIFTGYLVIYNIFRISVANDIRHYGMLKTIGTTGRQIRSIIRIQALMLSAVGIPVGLFFGWLVGAVLTPFVMNELNVYSVGTSVNPVIFVFSAVFALVTVFISCHIPASIASKVSPIEALKYTENKAKASSRNTGKKVTVFTMAIANLGRSKGRTALTIVSLALPIVIFSLTLTFTGSFSMDKYLSDITNDFVVSSSSYFNTYDTWDEENAISEEDIEMLRNMDGVTESFVSYGISLNNTIQAYYPVEYVRERLISLGNDPESAENFIANSEQIDGKVSDSVLLMGVEEGFFKNGNIVYEGDLSKLNEDGYIAVKETDNFKIGDKVLIRYTDSCEYIDTKTGKKYADLDSYPEDAYETLEINKKTHVCEYEVAVVIKSGSIQGYGYTLLSDFFYINSDFLLKEITYASPLYIAFNAEDEAEPMIEEFLSAYTENTDLDYSSKAKTIEEFESFKRMFVILGCTLSFIIGLVGILNFTNTILTGILSRRLELAVLQAIGMTGKQLKTMLITEGLTYTMGATVTAVTLNLLSIPLSSVIEKIFWFCDYRFTPLPSLIMIPLFILIGSVLPLITYKNATKKSIVERIRECE